MKFSFTAAKLGCGIFGLIAFGLAGAQEYPTREVRLIVPWNAGGAVDITARMISKLAQTEGLTLVVDNVPGATGSIGMAKIAAAKPDGYTLGIGTTSQLALVAQGLTKTKNDQFTYLNQVSVEQFLLVVPGDSKIETPEAFMASIKSSAGKVSIGTAGGNNVAHILAMTTAEIAGGEIVHVPYPGGAKVVGDLSGKQISAGVLKPSESKGQIQAGLIKPIAVYSENRIPSMPNVPSFAEKGWNTFPQGPLIQMSYLVAPANLPASVSEKLTLVFNKILQSSEYKAFANENGFSVKDTYGSALKKEVNVVQNTLNIVAPKLFKKQ